MEQHNKKFYFGQMEKCQHSEGPQVEAEGIITSKQTQKFVKGKVRCADAMTMQLLPSKCTCEQEPSLFKFQCYCKMGEMSHFLIF